jgi:hypothetical protein
LGKKILISTSPQIFDKILKVLVKGYSVGKWYHTKIILIGERTKKVTTNMEVNDFFSFLKMKFFIYIFFADVKEHLDASF